MDTKTMGKNWWTTVTGILAGVFYYVANSGATMPSNKQEWINLGVGALLAAMGYVAKDATTGSKPS